jgi:uncharacterized repeat protein (TIGR01451 family)
MFKKLLSNLPFNPSLIGQVSFYAHRLHKEERLRKIGIIMVILSVLIQMFAVISPPEPTLAESNNDIVRGGFTSRDQALWYCAANTGNFKTILQHYGVSCDLLAKASTRTVRSTDYNKKLHSMGRISYGQRIARTNKPTNEYPVDIAGAGRFYMRNMWAWDSGAYSTYKVLQVTNPHGQTIMIMYSCGNIVTIDRYVPPPPPPPPAPTKTVVCSNIIMNVRSGSKVKKGTVIEARGQATGRNLSPGELADMDYYLVNASNNKRLESRQARGIPFKGGVAQDSVPRKFKLNNPGRYHIKLAVKYDLNGVKKNASGNESGDCVKLVTVEADKPVAQPDPPKPQYSCPEAEGNDEITACLEFQKTASNVTQSIEDADGTTANAGDTITYRLIVRNTGTQTVPKFVIEENLSDVLQYSDIVSLDGGKLDDSQTAVWPAIDIGAKKTVEKKITVKVKDPIPQTPISASDPGAFDLVMTNVFYEDQVDIMLPPSVIKTTEQVVTTLPETGAGTNIAIAFSLTVMASYFFARTRLLSKEIEIVRSDYTVSGSY